MGWVRKLIIIQDISVGNKEFLFASFATLIIIGQ